MEKEKLVFLSAKQTPRGANFGSLMTVGVAEIGCFYAKDAPKHSGMRVVYTSPDTIYLPRHSGLKVCIGGGQGFALLIENHE